MGLFGGSSHSSTTNNQTTNTYNQGADGDNDGVMVSGSNNTVTYTDHDAVSKSMQLAQAALDDSADATDDALDFGNQALKAVTSGYDSNLQTLSALQAKQTNTNAQQMQILSQLASSESSGGATELLSSIKQMVMVIAAVIGVAVVVVAWRKG